MDTTTLDLLYLEIGQFTKARTNRDLKQERSVADLSKALGWMLDVYWGEGDGQDPEPAVIRSAKAALQSARDA